MEKLLDYEEVHWAQKARHMWLVNGDRNIFSLGREKRKVNNKITKLKDDYGHWISCYNKLDAYARDFFDKIYKQEEGPPSNQIL